jgi:hypothetical protein
MNRIQFKKLKFYSFILLAIIFFLALALITTGKTPVRLSLHNPKPPEKMLWKYQCVDTMKTSRDRARNWMEADDAHSDITLQVKAIKSLGANCIAIDTPYDPEFLPYLKAWVRESRKQKLLIWFRGNFSSWEGWFEYRKGMSSDELFDKTTKFITENPELFEDGDIFTPAPEGENGGPFNQVEKDEHEAYRAFLLKEHQIAKDAFAKIGKKVEVNWMSMNGGLAKRMFDQPTIDGLGKVVTLDHYIKTAPEMGEFIEYFAKNYGAKTIIGEFGAPIPEINGSMTEDQQAAFIDELFQELYKHKDTVIGVNYWVLYDSSTALYNQDFSERKAVDVVRKYFIPNIIKGRVADQKGNPIVGALVKAVGTDESVWTDDKGEFVFVTPNDSILLYASFPPDMLPAEKKLELKKKSTKVTLVLRHKEVSFMDRIKQFFRLQ